jgi:hypothetical protein
MFEGSDPDGDGVGDAAMLDEFDAREREQSNAQVIRAELSSVRRELYDCSHVKS